MIQSQCKEIGLTINIVELDSAGISTTTTNGEHQSCLYGMGFNIFGDDARRILQPGSAVNKAHYDSPEVMELLDKAVAEEGRCACHRRTRRKNVRIPDRQRQRLPPCARQASCGQILQKWRQSRPAFPGCKLKLRMYQNFQL